MEDPDTASTPEPVVEFDDVVAARDRIAGHAHRTPVMTSRLLDERTGRRLFFKCENLQRGGAFKIRGATNKLLTLTDAERKRGVVAYSSGNHAQAVALAARAAGSHATIAMPSDAPRAKMEATRGYGATVVEYDRRTEDRVEVARGIAEAEGRVIVPPYDDPWVIAGQGTAALELLEDDLGLDAIVAPVGGGGLLAGTATAAAGYPRPVPAWGAEPALADDTARSLESGERIRIEPPDTIADGARARSPGELTFPIVQRRAAGVVRVPDPALVEATALLLTRMKLLVEPTGALAAAAVFEGLLPPDAERIGVILSGGNVDLATLADLLGDPGA
ncbi:MAG: pyridoxal-phosphate dependent enzyme [Gemmatimonadota bacterium]|nr:pyridoxal-phosphate dependent enzyme [Gemmatimonadota bacterium]